jgi:hypothetical protein
MFSLGSVEPHTAETIEVNITDDDLARRERMSNRPPLHEILNLHDFEVSFQLLPRPAFNKRQAIARQVMPAKAWAYYSSAADDEITNRENHAAYHRQIDSSQNSCSTLSYCHQNMVPTEDSHRRDRGRLFNTHSWA